MNATVAWSYQLLAGDEQVALRRFAVLSGPFPLEAAAAVQTEDGITPAALEHARRTVAGLVERSVLQCLDTSRSTRPLYRMLETVRAYAAGALTDAERHLAMDGLARYCLTTAAAAEDQLVGHQQQQWLDRVRDDLENFRSALAWLVQHDRHTEACDIVWGLMFFWLIRGHALEGLRWYDQLSTADTLPSSSRASAFAGAGVMLYAQGELDESRRVCERSLALSGDVTTVASGIAELRLGHVERSAGNVAVARARFTAAVARFDDLALPWGRGNSRAGLAWTALAAGDLDTTERLLDEAAAPLSDAGPWASLIVLYVRAALAVRRHQPNEAIAYARESLARIHALHDRFAFLYALAPLAAAAGLTGDDAWAARIVGIRDAATERTGVRAVDESTRHLWQRVERDARARIGQRRWTREYENGRCASMESLLKDVDERCRHSSVAEASLGS
jgi:tetratricopeptide (TPR) repeat protein